MSWPLLSSAFHDVLEQHPLHISFRKRGGSGPGTLDRVRRVGALSDSVRLTHTHRNVHNSRKRCSECNKSNLTIGFGVDVSCMINMFCNAGGVVRRPTTAPRTMEGSHHTSTSSSGNDAPHPRAEEGFKDLKDAQTNDRVSAYPSSERGNKSYAKRKAHTRTHTHLGRRF